MLVTKCKPCCHVGDLLLNCSGGLITRMPLIANLTVQLSFIGIIYYFMYKLLANGGHTIEWYVRFMYQPKSYVLVSDRWLWGGTLKRS